MERFFEKVNSCEGSGRPAMPNLSSTLPFLNDGGCNDSITIRNRGFTAGNTLLLQSGECTRHTFSFSEYQIVYSRIVKVDTLIVERYDRVCV
jgi:hypothetical protein